MKNWEANIRRVTPYTPGEQPREPRMIKLNTNENPYPPSPAVEQAAKELGADRLRLYPDPASSVLTEALAGFYRRKPEEIFVGVGSDDVLSMCFLTFFNSEKPVFFPDLTYSFYKVWAELYRIPYECQKLDADFRMVKEDYYKANGGVIFPNPNAPTGVCQDLAAVEDIVAHNRDVVVIVDEAYIDFGGKSALELIDRYDNLLVVQTFSKSRSLAGMRVGYAMGNKILIKYLNDVKYSFNSYTMNAPTLAAAVEAVKAEEYFKETKGKIVATRERVKVELGKLGFRFQDSQANFLFITHPQFSAREIFEALKIKKIYVRYFNKPRIDNYLRVTIGTDEEMDELISFLKKFMGK